MNKSSSYSCESLQLTVGGSAVLELFEDASFYLVCQLLKGCATGSSCLLFYHEPHLIVRWLAKYFLFYLQALDITVQWLVDPFIQLLIGYPIQYCIDIADLKHWLYCAVVLAPGAKLVVLNLFYYPRLDWILVYISQQYGEVGHVVDWLALEALFEQVSVATILSIIIIHVGACYAFYRLAYTLFALTNEQVKVG